jgi:hypothetical protein
MRRTRPVTRIDRDALTVALVLAPAIYSRNRFFDLYTDPETRQVRRRASMIRSMTRQLVSDRPGEKPVIVSLETLENGSTSIVYEVAALNLKRTTRLSPVEVAVMRVALSRSGHAPDELGATDADRALVDTALIRLAPSREDRSPSVPPAEA